MTNINTVEKVQVRMHDGQIVSVAKGTPKEEILAKYERFKAAKANSATQLTKDIAGNVVDKPFDALAGIGDVLLGSATGAVGTVLGAAGGAVRQPLEAMGLVEDRGTFSDFFNQARESMTWEPRSETGKKATQLLSKPFEAAAEAAPGAADWMYEQMDSPAAAAATKALVEGGPEAALFALGFKGAKARADAAAKIKNDAAIAKAEADALAAAAKDATDMATRKKSEARGARSAAKADAVQKLIDEARGEQAWKRDFDNPEFQKQSDVVHQYYGNEVPWEDSPVSNVGKVIPEEVNLGDAYAVKDAMGQITKERQMEAGFAQNMIDQLAAKYPDRSNAAKRGPNAGKFGQGGALDTSVFEEGFKKLAEPLSKLSDKLAGILPKGTYATNSDGTPKVFLHGTKKLLEGGKEFSGLKGSAYDLGIHVASGPVSPHKIFNGLLADIGGKPESFPKVGKGGDYYEGSRIWPLVIKDGKFASVSKEPGRWENGKYLESGNWGSAQDVMTMLKDDGIFTDADIKQVKMANTLHKEAEMSAIRRKLREKGYIGIKYPNSAEKLPGKSNTESYVVFDSGSITHLHDAINSAKPLGERMGGKQSGQMTPGVFEEGIQKIYRSVKGNKEAFTSAVISQFGNKMGKHIDNLYSHASKKEAINVAKGQEILPTLGDNAPVVERPAGYAQSSIGADPTTSAFFDALLDPQRARKPVSNAETIQKARAMGLTETEIAKAVKKSEDMPAVLVAAGDFVAAQAKEIKAAAKRAVETGSAEDIAAVGEMYQRMTSAQHLARMSSATGRALQANKILKRAVRSKAEIDDLFSAMGGNKKMDAFVRAMADLPEEMIPGAIRNRRWGNKFQELYINSLLSGIMTQANAFTGTAFNLAYQVPLTYGSWAVGKLPIKGKAQNISLSDANAFAFGAIQGMKEAGHAALLSLRTNEPIIRYQGKNTVPERTVNEIHGHRAFTGKIGAVVSSPSRLLLTQDSFFKSLAYAMEMNMRASMEANRRVKAGEITPDQISNVIAEIKKNPSKEMHDAAVAMADKVTFTGELGDFGRSVQRMINHHPAGTVIFPFIRTTTNIYKQSVKGTPLGLVAKSIRDDLAKGGVERGRAAAHMLTGSVVAWTLYNMAMEDKIIGSAGVDPDRYAAHMNKYGAEYAYVNDDGQAIPLRVLEPFTMIGTLAADLATIQKSIPFEEWNKLASMFTVAVTNALLNKNFTQTASDLVLGITNPEVYGNRPLGLINTLTTPRIVAQAERITDPTLQNPAGKQPEDLDPNADPAAIMLRRAIDQWKKEIPGLSKDIPTRYDYFGRAILKPSSVANPFHPSEIKDTPQDEAVWNVRNIWTPKSVEDKVYGVELDKYQRAQYQKLTGIEFEKLVSNYIANPSFSSLPLGVQAEQFKKAYTIAKKVGAAKLTLSDPTLMNKLPQPHINRIKALMGDGRIR